LSRADKRRGLSSTDCGTRKKNNLVTVFCSDCYLSVGGRRHALVSGLRDDPHHSTDWVLVTGPHRRQFDGIGAASSVEKRQLAVLHTAAQHEFILAVVVDRRQMMRRFQHQLRRHRVHCRHRVAVALIMSTVGAAAILEV